MVRRPLSLLSAAALAATTLVAVTAAGAAPAQAAAPVPVTVTFEYTGDVQNWVVPPGVTSVDVMLHGAQGGGSGSTWPAGLGGSAAATLGVTPGGQLVVVVGGAGSNDCGYHPGFNGGGTSQGTFCGYSGGGATDVRVGGGAVSDRVLVAGGGGGSAFAACGVAAAGGGGGGEAGDPGSTLGCGGGTSGGGGTQNGGGINPADAALDGTLGQGGPAGGSGGAGGGGYYGGAGGTNGNAAGGGGSGYGPAGTVFETGVRSGNGRATITYVLPPQQLSVSIAGAGSGTVSSSPAGIDCGADCTETFDALTDVTLTATPTVGSQFAGWSGECSGTGTCTVTMVQARSVGATFTLVPTSGHELAVSVAGEGTVASTPAGIDCGNDCAATYDEGTEVALTATPAEGWSFVGWSGACVGTGGCTVTMDWQRSVTAQFARDLELTDVIVTPNPFKVRGNAVKPTVRWELSVPAEVRVRVKGVGRSSVMADEGAGQWRLRGTLAPVNFSPGRYTAVVKAIVDGEVDRVAVEIRVRRR